MAASAAAAVAQETAGLSDGPSGKAPHRDSKTAKQAKQSGSAKKAGQRQRKQVALCPCVQHPHGDAA